METTEQPQTLMDLRTARSLSKREVARRMSQTHQNIIRIESSGNAPLDTLEAYANAVGFSLTDVISAALETRRRVKNGN